MNKNSLLIVGASLLSGSALAGTMGPINQAPAWNWVATLSAGPVWENGGRTQTFYLTPETEKTYVAQSSTDAIFAGEMFVGVQKSLSSVLQGQLGLAVGSTSSAALSGIIWDDADPQFDNYTYRYKIQHTYVAAKAKLLADAGYWLTPWISGSIGAGFNNAHAYSNTPTIFEAVTNPNFASNTQTAFTYTIGAGVQKALSHHWQVGVGYEFADWGKSELGRAAQQTLHSGLALNHLYTNGALFSLTYLG